MEEDDDDKRLLSQLQLHCNEEAIRRAQLEVSSLLHSNLPPKPPKVRKLLCLALRRDSWALLSCQPAFGVTGVPQHLLIFRTFDAMLRDCLKDTLRRTSQLVQGLPLASVAGPWEGGHQVEGVPPAARGRFTHYRGVGGLWVRICNAGSHTGPTLCPDACSVRSPHRAPCAGKRGFLAAETTGVPQHPLPGVVQRLATCHPG